MLIPLNNGAYTARNLIANAQRCINLYPEQNPTDTNAPVVVTHYPTPGLTLRATPATRGAGRGAYTDITGVLFVVIGATVYKVSSTWVLTSIGTIDAGTTPVYMIDNGTTVFLVDGKKGYTFDITTGNDFEEVTDADFYGSTRVDYLNTYLLFAQPNTPTFYTTLSNTVEFDPLYFASLTGYPTDIVAAVMLHGNVWLIGERASEIWFNSGETDVLPFERMPEMVIHQGCAAKYSIARQAGIEDTQSALFWLGQNESGEKFIVRAQGYATKRVSTHAIESELQNYTRVDDAVGYAYQQDGHAFYVLNFPTADKTWCYDDTTAMWHERSWLDGNGVRHRHRAQCAVYAYGETVVLDWQSGLLYIFDLNNYTDNDQPIERVRSFPHLIRGMERNIYARFIADMDPGNAPETVLDQPQPLVVSLRWSDDRGHSWGQAQRQSLGTAGQYNKSLLWTRLGMARDRVFELSWSVNANTALNGAYVEPIQLAS